MKRSRLSFGAAAKYSLLVLIAGIQLFPLVWMILFSFKSSMQVLSMGVFSLPDRLHWENYTFALQTAHVARYFVNSIVVSACTIAVSTILAMNVAYAVARMRWRLRQTMLNAFLLGIMIPTQAIILPIYILMLRSHLYNTLTGIIVIYVVFSLPTGIYILVGYLRTLPREMEEAATVDGASIYRTYLSIIVPLISPAIATVVIFTFLAVWNEFMYAYIMLDDLKIRTLTLGILTMRTKYWTDWGPIGAGLVISSIPTILLYLAMSTQVQKSLVVGAIKA
jgi:raffinose/stachyose/melibiose transport system permease protein